jgi:ADP-ribose pyrophosphatase
MHLYLATGLVAAGHGRLTPDADEALELVRLPLADALAAVDRGDLHDAKTLIGILLVGRRRGG